MASFLQLKSIRRLEANASCWHVAYSVNVPLIAAEYSNYIILPIRESVTLNNSGYFCSLMGAALIPGGK